MTCRHVAIIKRRLKTSSGKSLTNGQWQRGDLCRPTWVLTYSFGDFLWRRQVAFPSKIFFFFLLCFLANQRSILHNFILCCPSQRSARGQVPSQVATHQEIGSQLWAGESPDSNPGLQDNSLAHYRWATKPPSKIILTLSLTAFFVSLVSRPYVIWDIPTKPT